MATRSLNEVVSHAFKRQSAGLSLTRRFTYFGAAGRRGVRDDDELTQAFSYRRTGLAFGSLVPPFSGPFGRLFSTTTGMRSLVVLDDESRALAAIQRLSLEVMAQALTSTGAVTPRDRMIVVPAGHEHGPLLLILSPDVADADSSRVVSEDMDLPLAALHAAVHELGDLDAGTPEADVFTMVKATEPEGVADLFWIARPEVVLTRRPRMTRMCAPSPHIALTAAGQLSTAGVYCRDESGDLGVTGCYHGTGPASTPVQVGPQAGSVRHADVVQDIVFIPLGNAHTLPPLAGRGGVVRDREPAKADRVWFDGATNHHRTTRVFGCDNGLLRARPSVQLRVQTDPDTDKGDSGSALIDDQDRVIAFAFERTDFDDYPQFTDWIWAANALAALKLVPI